MAELQQPDIVGNYLSRYNEAQQRQQAIADRQRTYQRQDRQDDMAEMQFEGQQDAQKLDMAIKRGSAMASIIGSVRDGDVQGFEAAKLRAAQELGIDPKQMAHLTINDLPRLRTESGLALKQLQEQAMRANIRQSDAAAAASNRANRGGGAGVGNAPQGYQWARAADGSMSLAPIAGGPADPNRIAPGEGVKVRASNAQLDALEQSLTGYLADLDKTTPVGRVLTRGPEVSKVETGHTDLLMQMKNLYELGVLNGPDYFLMTKMVEDPTSLLQIARGTDGLKAQADTIKSIIARSRNINNAKLGLPPVSAPQQGGDYRQEQRSLLGQPQQQAPAQNGGWSIRRVQ